MNKRPELSPPAGNADKSAHNGSQPERFRPVLMTSLAAYLSTVTALLVAKLWCIRSVVETQIGRRQLESDTSVANALSWLARDLLAALLIAIWFG